MTSEAGISLISEGAVMAKTGVVFSSLVPLAMAMGAAMAGCSGGAPAPDGERVGPAAAAVAAGNARAGKRLFAEPFPGTNGRSCATCHVESEHTALRPASVVARLARDPGDPLFNRIDADDPDADTPTYEHLK